MIMAEDAISTDIHIFPQKAKLNFIVAEQYDLRSELVGRTHSFTKNEIEQAKAIVLTELSKKDLEKYHPNLMLYR